MEDTYACCVTGLSMVFHDSYRKETENIKLTLQDIV